MKLILSALILAGLAGSAIAGSSDRDTDLRFDSAIGHVAQAKTQPQTIRPAVNVTLSSRNASNKGSTYHYSNPYGVGPNNDSR